MKKSPSTQLFICTIIAAVTAGRYPLFAQSTSDKAGKLVSPIQFVASGISDSRQRLSCAQANMTYYKFMPKRVFDAFRSFPGLPSSLKIPDSDQEKTLKIQWFLRKDQSSLLVEADPSASEIWKSERLVVNSKGGTMLREFLNSRTSSKATSYYSGGFAPVENIMQYGLWKGEEQYDPRVYAYYAYPGMQPLDELLLQNPSPAISKGESSVEGARCMKIELPRPNGTYWLIWVDLDHSFLLRRVEAYQTRRGRTTMYSQVRVLRIQGSNGIWFPKVVERKRFLQRPIGQVSSTSVGKDPNVILERVTVSDFKANCDIPDSAFVVKWPVGANVVDTVNQKKMIAKSEGLVENRPEPKADEDTSGGDHDSTGLPKGPSK